jgi:hypothetical protein
MGGDGACGASSTTRHVGALRMRSQERWISHDLACRVAVRRASLVSFRSPIGKPDPSRNAPASGSSTTASATARDPASVIAAAGAQTREGRTMERTALVRMSRNFRARFQESRKRQDAEERRDTVMVGLITCLGLVVTLLVAFVLTG